MRILWFSITPAKYGPFDTNGGGWIESLQRIVEKIDGVELGIAFMTPSKPKEQKVCQESTTYYPMFIHRNGWQRWYDKITYKHIDILTLELCKEVIEDYKPDLIQIFGSEWCFGLLYKYTNIPIVIHMQGCWNPYRNAEMPPGYNLWKPIRTMWYKPRRILNYLLTNYISKERALREEEILSNTRYFMGRTNWDKAIVKLYAPKAKYFYCSEALRLPFIKSEVKWQHIERTKKIFVSTGMCNNLKGYDVVLRTAKILKKMTSIDFQWLLIGPTEFQMKTYEYHTRIKCKDVKVVPLGNQDAETIRKTLLTSDIYIHLAYIDNSPNAVCEAQYLGVPVIGTYVGGVPSLFNGLDMGNFVPTNDPYYTASTILSLVNNIPQMEKLSDYNYKMSHVRHSDREIGKNLIQCYKDIIKDQLC